MQWCWFKELKMDKYRTLFALLLMISGLEGQFIISHVRGPLVFGNVSSFNNGTSVVNVVNSYDEDTDRFHGSQGSNGPVVINGIESNGPVIITGASSTVVGESSVAEDIHDDATTFPPEGYNDYGHSNTNNKYEEVQDNYELINGPLAIHSTGPAGISIENVQSNGAHRSSVSISNMGRDGQWNYQPAKRAAINVGHKEILTPTYQSSGNGKSSVSITSVHNQGGQSISVGPAGVSIHKVQNGGDLRPLVTNTNLHNQGRRSNVYPAKEETINVGQAGISIYKVHEGGDQKSSGPITNRGQNYYPEEEKAINVGHAGIQYKI